MKVLLHGPPGHAGLAPARSLEDQMKDHNPGLGELVAPGLRDVVFVPSVGSQLLLACC